MVRMVRAAFVLAIVAIPMGSQALGAPSTSDLLMAKSRAADRAGNRAAAMRLAESAIVADPGRAASYVELGDLYMRAGQPDFASFYYSEALEIDPLDMSVQKALTRADAAVSMSTSAAASATAAAAAGSLDKGGTSH
ncbi:MAG: tetratricopeptide repeat protein [Alphaproteobacteria bacterium]|nr:tetratricopeptide repeat protein [Alphaproteobacteria bacterium]